MNSSSLKKYDEQREYYQKKYNKYLLKNKLLLKQIEKTESLVEQEVKYISIEFTDVVSSGSIENDMMNSIIELLTKPNDGKQIGILQALIYLQQSNKERSLKKKYKKIGAFAESKYNELYTQLQFFLSNIRGENTLLNFDLAYITDKFYHDENSKPVNKKVYVLMLLPPAEHIIPECVNYDPQAREQIGWRSDDHDNEKTQRYKWLSCNSAWKWDLEKQTWLSNDTRPWYHTNIPSSSYVKSIDEWNSSLSEIINEEKSMKDYLKYHENLIKPKDKQKRISMFEKISSYIFGNSKVHVTLDDDFDDSELLEKSIKSTDSTKNTLN